MTFNTLNMKKLIFLRLIFVFLFVLTLLSCQRNNNMKAVSDYYNIMTTEKAAAAEYFKNYGICTEMGTKAGDSQDESVMTLPQWAYDYVLEYMNSNAIESWDEYQICMSLETDNSLSEEQKTFVATVIGDFSALKESALDYVNTETKAGEADCRAAYYRQVRNCLIDNISVGAIGGGVLSGFMGVELGIIGGLIHSWREIQDYGIQYIKCTA